jgi:hypothetical protein
LTKPLIQRSGLWEAIGDKIGRIAVYIGARVASAAERDEVLVSNTVKDLVAGSGTAFKDRGTHALKALPGEWWLFVVTGPRDRFRSRRAQGYPGITQEVAPNERQVGQAEQLR